MGCNCGKRKKLTASAQTTAKPKVTLTMPDGTSSTHDSRLEAEAQNVRSGGGGKFRTHR